MGFESSVAFIALDHEVLCYAVSILKEVELFVVWKTNLHVHFQALVIWVSHGNW